MSKKNDTWMPLYIGDYLADTSRLSTEQHGAYLLLLMDYWRNGPPLDDDEELASITKLALPQWRKHAAKIRALFRVEDGRLVQKRAEEERQRAGLVSSKRSEAGKQGAAKRWGKTNAKANSETMASAMANAWQNDAPSQSQSHTNTNPPPTAEVVGAGEPTPAGLVCMALKRAGIGDVNPGNATLRALIDAGATVEEFTGFAPQAVSGGKGFAWILGAVKGERTRAASTAGQLHRGPLPAKPPTAAEQRVLDAVPSIAAPHLRRLDPANVIDLETSDVTPRALG